MHFLEQESNPQSSCFRHTLVSLGHDGLDFMVAIFNLMLYPAQQGRQRILGDLVLKHSVPINTLQPPTFRHDLYLRHILVIKAQKLHSNNSNYDEQTTFNIDYIFPHSEISKLQIFQCICFQYYLLLFIIKLKIRT